MVKFKVKTYYLPLLFLSCVPRPAVQAPTMIVVDAVSSAPIASYPKVKEVPTKKPKYSWRHSASSDDGHVDEEHLNDDFSSYTEDGVVATLVESDDANSITLQCDRISSERINCNDDPDSTGEHLETPIFYRPCGRMVIKIICEEAQ